MSAAVGCSVDSRRGRRKPRHQPPSGIAGDAEIPLCMTMVATPPLRTPSKPGAAIGTARGPGCAPGVRFHLLPRHPGHPARMDDKISPSFARCPPKETGLARARSRKKVCAGHGPVSARMGSCVPDIPRYSPTCRRRGSTMRVAAPVHRIQRIQQPVAAGMRACSWSNACRRLSAPTSARGRTDPTPGWKARACGAASPPSARPLAAVGPWPTR